MLDFPSISHPVPLSEGPWNLWADRVTLSQDRVVFHHTGEKWWTQMHNPENMVPVHLIEDPQGEYWSWMDSEQEHGFPCMIWPGKNIFRMCFAAAPESLIAHLAERGQLGKIVRLTMTERPDDGTDSQRTDRGKPP